jgi:hypothetical protein
MRQSLGSATVDRRSPTLRVENVARSELSRHTGGDRPIWPSLVTRAYVLLAGILVGLAACTSSRQRPAIHVAA